MTLWIEVATDEAEPHQLKIRDICARQQMN
jgi:hypothetical protein